MGFFQDLGGDISGAFHSAVNQIGNWGQDLSNMSVLGIPSQAVQKGAEALGGVGAMAALGGLGGGVAAGASGSGAGGWLSTYGPDIMKGLGYAKDLYGAYQAYQMQQLAQKQQAIRDHYISLMNNLSKNPASLVNTPGYQAGLQAVERRMAGEGYLGSGNMMAALSEYGANAYNQQMSQWAQMAGQNFSPLTPAQVDSTQLMGQSLSGLGQQFGGG